MKRRHDLIEWAMEHPSIIFFVVGLMVLFGVIALVVMPKQEFPEYTIRQGVIVGIFPGATSEEVEEELAGPLEEFLFSFPEIRRGYTTTTSENGMCYAMVELNENVKDKDEVWSKIKHGLETLKLELPSGVVALVAKDDFGDTSALLLALESESRSYKEMKGYADELGDRFRRLESVSNVKLYGDQEEQITVYVDRDRLASYGINDKILMSEVFAQSLAPGGSVSNDQIKIPVHIKPSYSSVQEVEDQIIYSDPEGNLIRLKDIANVVREYPEGESYVTYNGNSCLVLSLEMRAGFNIVKFGRDVDKVLDGYKANTLPSDVNLERITDQAQVVNTSVNSFLRDMILAIMVIIIVMMLLFPLRSALVAAIVIPLNSFISIGLMYLFGIPLNTVTFAALIVVLGMTVDNSIVMIDGYIHLLGEGLNPKEAAINSARKYFMPMFLATACICLIFYPILILFKGMFAEFTYFFPYTITINLMISLFLAVLLIPYLEVAIIKPRGGVNSAVEKKRFTEKIHSGYVKLLEWNFRHAWITISIGVVSILVSILLARNVNFRMMPYAERDQFAVEIYMPDGTTINRTAVVADSLMNMLLEDDRIKSVTQFIGMSSPRFQISYAPQMPSDSYAQFIVNTGSTKETEEVLDQYTDYYANYFPNAYVRFKQIDYQRVPTFEFRFYGDNIEELKSAADLLSSHMSTIGGLTNIQTDWGEKLPVADVALDQVKASQLGVMRAITAANLMLATDEISMGSVSENNKNIPIVLKSGPKGESMSLEDLKNTYVSTLVPTVNVPLRQIASVEPVWSENKIIHRNGVRTISVTADPMRGVMPVKILNSIQNTIENEIMPSLPYDVNYQVGGVPEDNHDSLLPVLYAIVAAFLVIFFFLLFTYGKFGLTFISMFTLFLFTFGGVFGLWVSGTTVGLTTVLGLIGLFGITVRNVILMFQHAEQRFVNEGWSAKDAAFDAGKRRMIPIFLTSAAASVGVVPMIISGSSFWAPVGVVMFGGGIFLLLMTITILPVLYWKLNDKKK